MMLHVEPMGSWPRREHGAGRSKHLARDRQWPALPDDYVNGGALLPMAGPKGYGMALMAELLGEAIRGDAMWGGNWICICVHMARFRGPSAYRTAAEQCLAEQCLAEQCLAEQCLAGLRECPPAPGFSRVEIPGEREAALRTDRLEKGIPIAPATLRAMGALGIGMGLDVGELQAVREAVPN